MTVLMVGLVRRRAEAQSSTGDSQDQASLAMKSIMYLKERENSFI